MRLKLTLSYNGANFLGFQIQNQTKQTVANQIDIALKKLGIKTTIVASGRTDKGVHARNQVIHIDVEDFWSLTKLKIAINKILPNHIFIKNIEKVSDTFHARYDAIKRSYLYIFSTSKSSPFYTDIISYIQTDINEQKIEEALSLYEGVHNFEYFMKQGSGIKQYEREIYKTKLIKLNKNTYACYFLANGFLRSQIRIMMDFIFKVSNNRLSIKQLEEQLYRKTLHSNTLASPNGLYLSKIYYNS